MRIDQKYYSTFLIIVALVAAIVIAIFTFSNRKGERDSFKKTMFAEDSLQTLYWPSMETSDSVQIADFEGQFVVVDLWSNLAEVSLESHKNLAAIKKEYADTLQIIAASVGLKEQQVLSYIQEHGFQFYFAEGSHHFSKLNVPGLPAQLVYNPDGNLQSVFMGYPDDSQYDSLRRMINEERN